MPTKNFNAYPRLRDLLPRTGGLPGVQYLVCPAQRVAEFGQEDNPSGRIWEMTTGAEVFTIKSIPCFLLSTGKPIMSASSSASLPEFFTTNDLDVALGVEDDDDLEALEA